MKTLITTLSLLSLISCGGQTSKIEIVAPDEMPAIVVDAPEDININIDDPKITFGPDFEAWLSYCEGQVSFKIEQGLFTENEYEYQVKECYYNLDLTIPDLNLPDITEIPDLTNIPQP